MATTTSSGRPMENVWEYPRPAKAEPTKDRLQIIWKAANGEETVVADTTNGYRVLETTHPPTYYFPPGDVKQEWLKKSNARQTYCEWKGKATYHDLAPPGSPRPVVTARIWSYENPTPSFHCIKDHFCFYCDPRSDAQKDGTWICKVADEVAKAQEGDFYGSWVTSWISGGPKGFKGGAGTWGW